MKDKAHWYIAVTKELDKRAFEAAHDAKVSKSAYIREAVEERIARVNKPQKEDIQEVFSNPVTKENSIFNPTPKPKK